MESISLNRNLELTQPRNLIWIHDNTINRSIQDWSIDTCGHISEDKAIRELESAAMGFRDYPDEKIRKTVEKGLSDGMRSPRHLKCHQ